MCEARSRVSIAVSRCICPVSTSARGFTAVPGGFWCPSAMPWASKVCLLSSAFWLLAAFRDCAFSRLRRRLERAAELLPVRSPLEAPLRARLRLLRLCNRCTHTQQMHRQAGAVSATKIIQAEQMHRQQMSAGGVSATRLAHAHARSVGWCCPYI